MWDAQSWRRLRKVVQLEAGIDTCAVSAGGDLVALGCDDGYVRVHDRAANATIACEGKFDQAPRRSRFLPDGRLLSVGRFGLMVHDPATGERLHAQEAGLTVCDWALGPGGIVALAGSRGAVSLYDLAAEEVVRTLYLDRDEGLAWSCSFSPDGSRLLAGGGKPTYSDDVPPFGQSSVWRTDTWETDHERGHDVMATACCFHRDDAYVVGLLDGTLRVYGADGEPLGTVSAHSSTVRSLRAAGDLMVSASLDSRVRAWSVPSLLDGAGGPAGRALFCAGDKVWTGSPQPRFEYAFHEAGGSKLWMDGDLSFRLQMFRRDIAAPLTGVRVTYDGPKTAPHVTDPTHGPGQYWLLASAARMSPFDISQLPALPPALHSPENVRWAFNGSCYALLQRGRVHWIPAGGDVPRGTIDFECDPNVFHLPQVSLSADGLHVYFIAGERLYRFDPLRRVTAILHTSESGPLHAFCESPDRSRIAIARDDGALCVVPASTDGPVEKHRGHDGAVLDCAWLGEVPLSLGRDGSLRLWGPAQAVFVGTTAITAFSVGERIVAADAGGRVYVLAPHVPVS